MKATIDTRYAGQRANAADRQVQEALATLDEADTTPERAAHVRAEISRAEAKRSYWRAVAQRRAEPEVGAACRLIGHTWTAYESNGWRVATCSRCGTREQRAL